MDEALKARAERAGVAPRWRDVHDNWHDVAPETLTKVLDALGDDAAGVPPLITADLGQAVTIDAAGQRYRLTLEDGTVREGVLDAGFAVDVAGYHRLAFGDREVTVAVAPPRCFTLADAGADRVYGIAVQLYALRRAGDGGIGDYEGLAGFVRHAAAHGAAAVAISPVHAQFSADPDRFSPYAPSSRIALNALHADADALLPAGEETALEALPLVEWPEATRRRLARLRRAYGVLDHHPEVAAAFAAYRVEHGEVLASHARFEALHAARFGADPTQWNWRDWPEALRDPRGAAVAAFAAAHADEVGFHAFLQFLADRGLARAQAAAREAGMPIGLIADLAVGTDGGGSHAWGRQGETLLGLSIGAPPDLLNTSGQNWGLATFSPRGLVQNGFGGFIEMLRAALRHAGGVRIDHAMGLARLWVVPDGASAKDGAYLHFPVDDMLRLVALESQRHRAIVLGEDLGTLPEGFQARLDQRGIMGMRLLYFEQEGETFTSPRRWSKGAAAMTSTHDLPPVAGWWKGNDLAWRVRLGQHDEVTAREARDARAHERLRLWEAFRGSGAAGGPVPEVDDTAPVVDAALRHAGGAACELAMIPIEDVLGLVEAPNFPGTLDEHPNWRRRLEGPAETLLTPAAERLAGLAASRHA